jgi:hypothetical protein
LNFLPLPQGHGSLRPTSRQGLTTDSVGLAHASGKGGCRLRTARNAGPDSSILIVHRPIARSGTCRRYGMKAVFYREQFEVVAAIGEEFFQVFFFYGASIVKPHRKFYAKPSSFQPNHPAFNS